MKKTFLLLAFLFLTLNAKAQEDITVTASVQAPLAVTVPQNLSFEALLVGETKTIQPSASRSAIVFVDGTSAVNVGISFTLPTNLTDGTNTLPISFSATSAGFAETNDKQTLTSFDPNNQTVTSLSSIGELYVFLGGTITSGGLQPIGNYSGTVQVTVSYN